MPDYENLLRYEREHSAVDFKKKPYHREQHQAFLKDVVAMANADVSGDRYIVWGVKQNPDGTRELDGIDVSELKDAAVYQQLARENIEPDLGIEIHPYELDGRVFGILRIHACDDRPYLMRKKFGDLERGEGWIRIGSHQPRLTRRDLDRIYAERLVQRGFTEDVRVGFDAPGQPTEITLRGLRVLELPSQAAAAEIHHVLHSRRTFVDSPLLSLGSFDPFGARPYHTRTTDELHEALENLSETYEDLDNYVRYEKYANRLNLVLLNSGSIHLEDALLEIRIPNQPGVFVADDLYQEPIRGHFGERLNFPLGAIGYPEVTIQEPDWTLVTASIGDLRHQVLTPAFKIPLRLTLGPESVNTVLPWRCTLYGRNLRRPFEYELNIHVAAPDASFGDTSKESES